MREERQANENVVILDCADLTSSIVAKDKVDGVIQKQLLIRMIDLIHESVLREKQKREKKNPDSFIDGSKGNDNFPFNYFIAGKRGSGKTTFLKQMVEKLEDGDRQDLRLKFLYWYDPSESFGVPEDLFITVTAAVKTKMQQLACELNRQNEYNSNRYRFCEDKLDMLDKAIVRFSHERKALSNMSEYRASALSSGDPEMNSNIRENFKGCMKHLCELYHVDAFILVIDDVDIRTKQCSNVLENLRLYLSNDYLIVLMAGDRENNLEHIRESFFKEYDIEYHRADRQGKEARMDSIISHAAQYFAKLFPVKQQFELKSLNTAFHKKDSMEIILRCKKNSKNDIIEESLGEWLLRIFNAAISMEDFEAKPYIKAFQSLPLRSIIQIIQYWIQGGIQAELDRSKSENPDEAKQSREQMEFLVRTGLNRSLYDQLPELSHNYEALESDDGRIFYGLLLHFCQETGNFDYGYYLTDKEEGKEKYKFLTLVLAVNFKRYLKDFKGFLSYLLYGPATITLYREALEQFKAAEAELRKNPVLTSQADFRRSFENYFHIGDWRSASRWARLANMIWCYDPDGYHIHSGVVRIQDSEILEKMGRYMIKAPETPKAFRRTMALIVSMNKSDGRDNNYYISIYSYLAYILHCVEICEEVYGADTSPILGNKEKELKQNAKQKLLDLTEGYLPIRSCRRPEWQLRMPEKEGISTILYIGKGILFEESPEKSIKGYDEPINRKADSLMDDIVEWYKKLRAEQKKSSSLFDNVTPQIMGILWSELYDYLRSISNLSVQKDGDKKEGAVQNETNPQYIVAFNGITEFFMGYMKLVPQTGRITRFYRNWIGRFPLTKYFNLYDILLESPRKKLKTE